MTIKDWPANERPREKLLSRGAKNLSDAELLAIFLRTGIAGRSAVDLARDLLKDFGSIAALLKADRRRFCAIKGLGDAKYAQLQSALELSRRHLRERLVRDTVFADPVEVQQFVRAHLNDYEHEVFLILFLDNRHRLIVTEELFRGTINGASVYPREVAKRALHHNAAALIFAHNHPSGVAEPSVADEQITRRLKEALGLLDIRVLDHIIVGSDHEVSLAERGVV
jgi:DNA repair protein RadC